MYSDTIAISLFITAMLAQVVAPGDWTHMASLPFAFAAASFLIWSMVQLFRLMFESWRNTTAETILTLRNQVAELRTAQAVMSERTVIALERNNETITASVQSWHEVHEDLRDFLTFVKTRPCLQVEEKV